MIVSARFPWKIPPSSSVKFHLLGLQMNYTKDSAFFSEKGRYLTALTPFFISLKVEGGKYSV